jgi:hypothetical protein
VDEENKPEANEPKPPPPAPINKSDPVDALPTTPATTQQLTEVEEQMSGFEKSTLRWAKTAVIMSAIAAIFVCAQWWEMHEGGADTHGLAVAAKNQADRMQDFANRMKDQNDRTKDLADRMKDQADRTKELVDQAKVQATESTVAANAAKSAAETAKDALHVSERAYVTIEEPAFDLSSKSLKLPLVNSGRIPAQTLVATVHTAFYELPDATGKISAGEPTDIGWQNSRYPSIGIGNHDTIVIPLPLLDKDRYNSGLQLIIVAGELTYGDGFPDSQRQTWDFCFRTFYQVTMKFSFLSPCDSSEYLPQLIRLDGYPNNEHKD